MKRLRALTGVRDCGERQHRLDYERYNSYNVLGRLLKATRSDISIWLAEDSKSCDVHQFLDTP